jgi:hypothetical protein
MEGLLATMRLVIFYDLRSRNYHYFVTTLSLRKISAHPNLVANRNVQTFVVTALEYTRHLSGHPDGPRLLRRPHLRRGAGCS